MAVDLIGFCGLSQAGKTTAASAVCAEFAFTPRSFADPIKDLLYTLNPPIVDTTFPTRLQDMIATYGWDRVKLIPDVRRMLQELGVGIRALDPSIWVRQMFNEPFPEKCVIDDVRFPNEVDEIKRYGGVVICIFRPGIEQMNHISERGVDHSILVENDCDLVTFRKRVVETVRPMLEGSE